MKTGERVGSSVSREPLWFETEACSHWLFSPPSVKAERALGRVWPGVTAFAYTSVHLCPRTSGAVSRDPGTSQSSASGMNSQVKPISEISKQVFRISSLAAQ